MTPRIFEARGRKGCDLAHEDRVPRERYRLPIVNLDPELFQGILHASFLVLV